MIQALTEFADIIGFPLPDLVRLGGDAHLHYQSWEIIKLHENGKPRRTKTGKIKTRRIDAPSGDLKEVQHTIKKKILGEIALPSNVYGVKGKGHVSNANAHKGKPFRFHTDIQNFYPSITAKHVYGELRTLGFSVPVAKLLRNLVTYGGRLTQGAPTSPKMANLVMRPIDEVYACLAADHNLEHSRYVDNIAFSGSYDFQFLCSQIISVFEQRGFRRNHDETFYKKGPVKITGLIVKQNILDVDSTIKERAQDPNKSEASRRGYACYIDQVKKESRAKK